MYRGPTISMSETQDKKLARALNRVANQLTISNHYLQQIREFIPKLRDSAIPDIPLKWVLVAARNRINRTGSWGDYYSVLCEYYGVPPIDATVNPNIGPKTIARFVPTPEPKIESRERTMDHITGLHEFGHYLFWKKRGYNAGEAEQALCDSFAEACLKRETSP